MSVAWPTAGGFPQLPMTARGSREGYADNILRSKPDRGPAKRRRVGTSATIPLSFGLTLTKAQTLILDTFFYTDLLGGAEIVSWVNPRTGDAKTLAFTAPPELGTPNGDLWPCHFEMEILP